MGLWLTAGLALLLAVVAWGSARRVGRKLERLNHAYWELRDDYTKLRAQVARLNPEAEGPEEAGAAPAGAAVGFVPLSAIKPRAKAGD